MSIFRTKIGVSGRISLFLTILMAFLALFQPVAGSEEAREGSGIIRGIAVDENGERLPQAKVYLKSVDVAPPIHISNSRKEDEPLPLELDFEWAGLKAGTYELKGLGEEIESRIIDLKEGQIMDGVQAPISRETELIGRIWSAIRHDKADQVCELLALGVDPNFTNDRHTLMTWAASRSGLDVVRQLVEAGAEINITPDPEEREKMRKPDPSYSFSTGLTPYEHALWNGKLNMAEYLLEQGASTNDLIQPPPGIIRGSVVDEEGNPINELKIELMQVTELESGFGGPAAKSDTTYSNTKGEYVFPSLQPCTWEVCIPQMTNTPAGLAELTPDSPIIRMSPLRIPEKVVKNQILLGLRWDSLSAEDIQSLLENGADVDCTDSNGQTPLMRMAFLGKLDCVRVLVEAGANLDAENDDGQTAVDCATPFGKTNVIAFLLEKGARPSDEEPPPPGLIRGQLRDEQDQPLNYILLQCSKKEQQKFNDTSWITMFDGSIGFHHLEPGDYQIRLMGLTNPIHTVTLTELEPAQTNLIFRAPRQATLNRGLWCQLQFDGPFVLELLEAGADADFQAPETGYTPLMVAYPLTPTIARALLEAGAEVNRTNHIGKTALMMAIEMWNPEPEVVQVLLEAGADVSPVNQEGNTALHLACTSGNLEIVNLLINAGSKLDEANQEGRTPLDLAVWGGHEEVADQLRALKAPGQVTQSKPLGKIRGTVRDGGGTPMHYSEVHCWPKGENPEVSQRRWSGDQGQYEFIELKTGTYEICLADSTHIARTVHLKNKNQVVENIDLSLPSDEYLNWQLLRCASSKQGNISELLEKGADPNTRDQDSGNTPLHYAVSHRLPHKVRALLEADASINATNCRGETALICAAEENHKKNVEILLEAGAHINATKKYGKTALMRATENNLRNNVKVLLNAGADIHRLDHMDCSALHLACEKGCQEIAMILIDAGADLQALNRRDRTPLDEAVWEGHTELADALRAKGAAGTLTAPKPSGSISGVVVDEEGSPIRNVHFQVMRMAQNGERSGGCSGIRTGADGSFVKRGEVAGCYRFASASQLDTPTIVCLTNKWDTQNDIRVQLPRRCVQEAELYAAVADNDAQAVTRLLVAGGDVLTLDCENKSLLELALGQWATNVVPVLLEHDVDLNAPYVNGLTPLRDVASKWLNWKIPYLLRQGAAVRPEEGGYPLILIDVTRKDDGMRRSRKTTYCAKVAQLLVDAGAPVNIQDEEGMTPLHHAALHNYSKCAQVLLKAGADLTTTNHAGQTPLDVAMERPKTRTAHLLREQEAPKVDSTHPVP